MTRKGDMLAAVQPDVPVENYRAMIQAWRDGGSYQGSEQ